MNVNVVIPVSQFFEYCEEAEWTLEVMKATGKPTAMTMSIGLVGDSNNVPPQECALRLARAGRGLLQVEIS